MDAKKIKKSITMIIQSGVNYEFRTTVYPRYVKEENVVKIAQYLKNVGSKEYFLQNYFDWNETIKPYDKNTLEEMRQACERYLPTKLKGIL